MNQMKRIAVLTTKEQALGEYTLRRPIIDGGQKIETLYFREPTMADIERMESAGRTSSARFDIEMIACLAGLLTEAAERITAADAHAIKEGIKGFLPPEAQAEITEARTNAMGTSMLSSSMDALATGVNG